jgi:tRNA(fMet)-specific endonuclease VapC
LLNPRVLDTTVASLLLDRHSLLNAYRPFLEGASLILSFQTVAEMRFGALKAGWGEKRKQQLEQFFGSFYLMPYSDPLGTVWAEIMFEARKNGSRLETGDGWIAATARHLNAPSVTHDQDFSERSCPSVTVYRVDL